MKLKNIFTALVPTLLLTACSALTIGEEEFSCSGKPDHELCMGPMEVYELTNNRDDLEHMMTDEYRQSVINGKAQPHEHHTTSHTTESGTDTTYIYDQRSLRRQNSDDYDKAHIVGVATNGHGQSSGQMVAGDELDQLRQFNYVPHDIAPEPLAVLEEAKAMRIYVAAYEDDSGDLNIPGFVYVELSPRKWVTGHQADMRPSRVVPFQMLKRSKDISGRKDEFMKGVDPLNIKRPAAQNYQ